MILLLFVISIFLGFQLKFSYCSIAIISSIYLIFVLLRYKKKVFGVCLSIFVISFAISNINIENNNQIKVGVVIESRDNYFLFLSKTERFYVYEKNNTREIGDFLSIEGDVSPIDFEVLESSFDMNIFLNKKGVYRQIEKPKIEIRFNHPIRIKKLKQIFLNRFSGDTKNFINSLFFLSGHEGEEVAIMQSLQLNRLISSSGIYLYALSNLLEFLLKRRIKSNKRKMIPLILIFIYQIFVFPKFAVLRFLINKTLKLINLKFFQDKIDYLNLLSFSMIISLMINRYYIYEDSFLIGYSIPLFLYFIRPIINRARWWKIPIIVTGIIYIFFIPFLLKYNNSINLLSPFIQAILCPFFIPFFIITFVTFIGVPIFKIVEFYKQFLSKMIEFSRFFRIEIHAPEMSIGVIILMYALLIGLFYYLAIKFTPVYKRIGLFLPLLLIVHFLPIENMIVSYVSFINVGQGDSCLIHKGNTDILIDTGGSIYKDIASECLIPYFKSKRIYDIDLVIITHNDYDHNGALSSLINNFKVDNVITKKDSFPININGILLENLNKSSYSDDNDNSLVLSFKMWGKRFLLMGDASTKVEKTILDSKKELKCDVLKIGHHGSNTSTSEDFIRTIKPIDAIVSVGRNYYGHPHKEVLSILDKYNVRIRRTDLEGTITYKNYNFL